MLATCRPARLSLRQTTKPHMNHLECGSPAPHGDQASLWGPMSRAVGAKSLPAPHRQPRAWLQRLGVRLERMGHGASERRTMRSRVVRYCFCNPVGDQHVLTRDPLALCRLWAAVRFEYAGPCTTGVHVCLLCLGRTQDDSMNNHTVHRAPCRVSGFRV